MNHREKMKLKKKKKRRAWGRGCESELVPERKARIMKKKRGRLGMIE